MFICHATIHFKEMIMKNKRYIKRNQVKVCVSPSDLQ